MNILNVKVMRTLAASLVLILAFAVACHAADQGQEELRNTVINLLQALVEQGVITKEKAQQMVKAAQDKAASEAGAKAKEDADAVRVPYVPEVIQDRIAQQVEPAVVADVLKKAQADKWGVPGALPDWITQTRISGTVTLREEDIFFDKGNVLNEYLNYFAINNAGGFSKAGLNAFENVSVDRARFRGKARLGVDSNITDSITAGMRIATGNTNDLVSETQTLDGTSPYQFGLDELYIRLDERNAQRFPWLSVVGGRYLNPYGTPTDMIFHKDLTFAGVAATGRLGLGDGSAEQSHLFLTVGAHPLQEIARSVQDKWLLGAQFGANVRWGEGQRLRVSAAFYDYLNVTGQLNATASTTLNYTAPAFLRQGNTYFNICNTGDLNSDCALFALASRYRLGNVNLSYELPLGRYSFGLTADVVRNFGFDAARVESNTGYYVAPRTKGAQAEFSFGTPTVLALGAWRGTLGYRYLQRDAVIDAYTESDFHFGGTDATGYYFVGDVGVAPRVWVRLRYLSSNAIDGIKLGIDTLQVDLNTRF